jgi:hypothetical protein
MKSTVEEFIGDTPRVRLRRLGASENSGSLGALDGYVPAGAGRPVEEGVAAYVAELQKK